jgi:putative inorganic carbon (HCO3(-)) transporter
VLRSLWLVALYLSFLGLGVATPFVMTLGYVWVDLFRPQDVTFFILNELPVAMIMGAGAVLSYIALDRRSPPPLMLQSVLQVLMAIWMTATLLWAEVPVQAMEKWDWAFKSMVFAAFVPLVIRSRVQIEAFAQTFVFSMAANYVPFGLKVLISGGGYGQNLGLLSGNSGLAEGASLAAISLMAVPMALFLGRHGQLIPRLPLMPLAYGAVAALAVVTALGTYERTGLVCIVVMAVHMFLRSRRKFLFGAVAGVVLMVAATAAVGTWSARMSTIGQFQTENSALIRLLVWKWTFDFSLSHPLGGSFNSYIVNTIVAPPDESNPGGMITFGRAFHSIYFEVLGELGWPGEFMFLLTAVSSLVSLFRLSRKCRKNPNLVWAADMSDAIQTSMLIFLSGGAFVGIAFQPMYWYFVSMGICLRANVWRAERIAAGDVPARRGFAQNTSGKWGPSSPGWSGPPVSAAEQPVVATAWRGRRQGGS